MHGLGHELLADAGLAGDQHIQLAGRDQCYVLLQLAQRRALAQQRAACVAGQGGLAPAFGALAFILGVLFELAHAPGRGHRGGREIAEGLQCLQMCRVGKAPGHKCVQRQQAPGVAADHQRAAHAVMHFQRPGMLDQAVIGIGQRAVGFEAQCLAMCEQGRQARVFGDAKAPAQRVAAEAIGGNRFEHLALQAQQRHGIARQQAAQCVQQTAVALALGQVVGQVGYQGHQAAQQAVGGCHFDS
ncbi:hypothetical protein D3C71_1402090 [compost metagenome]